MVTHTEQGIPGGHLNVGLVGSHEDVVRAIFRRKCGRARITVLLETLVRKWRAYSRPSGVIATMLDTSRRWLRRRSTGVRPRRARVLSGRAQVVPGRSRPRGAACGAPAAPNGMDRPCSPAEHGRTGLSRSEGVMP
jgi:hypothetical protein